MWAFYFFAILTTVVRKPAVFLLSDEAVRRKGSSAFGSLYQANPEL
jgi:hypothetical protein